MTDKKLTASELKIRYVLQHPKYLLDDWRVVVNNCVTLLGYWDWVVFKIALEPAKYTITVTLETTGVFDDFAAKRALGKAIDESNVFTGVYSIAIDD